MCVIVTVGVAGFRGDATVGTTLLPLEDYLKAGGNQFPEDTLVTIIA
jgi:hypothetical protein